MYIFHLGIEMNELNHNFNNFEYFLRNCIFLSSRICVVFKTTAPETAQHSLSAPLKLSSGGFQYSLLWTLTI